MSALTQFIVSRWPEIVTFLLVFGRTSGLMVSAPFWGSRVVPTIVRIWVAAILSLAVYPGVKVASLPFGLEKAAGLTVTLFPLVLALAGEILLGLILGWMAQILFAGMRLAGQQIEMKMGLSLLQLVDPQEGGHRGVFSTFLELMAGLIFFTLNGHHLLIQALSSSYNVFPLAGGSFMSRALEGMLFSAGEIFSIGFRVSAPVLVGLLLSDLILGIMSRAVPQMNVFLVAMPFQFGFGLILLMLSLPAIVNFFVNQLSSFSYGPSALGLAGSGG